jgi:hypothetical protein
VELESARSKESAPDTPSGKRATSRRAVVCSIRGRGAAFIPRNPRKSKTRPFQVVRPALSTEAGNHRETAVYPSMGLRPFPTSKFSLLFWLTEQRYSKANSPGILIVPVRAKNSSPRRAKGKCGGYQEYAFWLRSTWCSVNLQRNRIRRKGIYVPRAIQSILLGYGKVGGGSA